MGDKSWYSGLARSKYFSILEAVERIDCRFADIDSPGVVRAGASKLLQRGLTLARQEPVDEHFRRVGMGRPRRKPKSAAGSARPAALFPVLGIEIADRQLLLHCLPNFAAGVAADAERIFARDKPIGHMPGIAAGTRGANDAMPAKFCGHNFKSTRGIRPCQIYRGGLD